MLQITITEKPKMNNRLNMFPPVLLFGNILEKDFTFGLEPGVRPHSNVIVNVFTRV